MVSLIALNSTGDWFVVVMCARLNTGAVEDRWFLLLMCGSLLAHGAVFWINPSPSPRPAAQAPSQGIRVSLSLLREQQRQVAEQKPAPVSKRPGPAKKILTQTNPTPPKPVIAEPVSEPPQAPVIANQVQRGQGNNVLAIRRDYFSTLITHIEGHKFFPQAARRRGLNGAVEVSFLLLRNGDIDDLAVKGGPLLLRRAAERAVQQSLPMPSPPVEVVTPKSISFVMQYQLL